MTSLRHISFTFVAIFTASFAIPQTAFAQSWEYYMNDVHRFSGIFPGAPSERTYDYATANGATVPAYEFSAGRGEGRYSITVVDYSSQQGQMDGAVAHEAAKVRAMGTPGYDEFAQLNGIPGHAISVITPEGRQVISQMYLYETRLYIARGDEPPGVAPAAHFTQSIDIHHPDGSSVNINPGVSWRRKARRR
jgi:hypothetical protein